MNLLRVCVEKSKSVVDSIEHPQIRKFTFESQNLANSAKKNLANSPKFANSRKNCEICVFLSFLQHFKLRRVSEKGGVSEGGGQWVAHDTWFSKTWMVWNGRMFFFGENQREMTAD